VATIKTGLPTCANLNAVNLRGALFTMQVREGAEPFANVGIYQLKLDPTGNMYHLTANGLNPERTGTWSFGVDLGIATVLTVQNYFGNSQIVHWALLPDCTYELYADGLINNQSGLYFVSGGSTSEGTSVTFSVEATGRGPLKYQWHRNGTDIPGATQPTYTIPLVQVSDAGSYTVAVSNDGGTTPSDVAVLTVKSPDAGEALQFSRSANSITLSWPTGYSLQTTARLSPGNWRDVLGASPQTISTASAQAYFRLIKR